MFSQSQTPSTHLWHFQTSTSELSPVRELPRTWDKLPYKHQQMHLATVVHNLVPIQNLEYLNA